MGFSSGVSVDQYRLNRIIASSRPYFASIEAMRDGQVGLLTFNLEDHCAAAIVLHGVAAAQFGLFKHFDRCAAGKHPLDEFAVLHAASQAIADDAGLVFAAAEAFQNSGEVSSGPPWWRPCCPELVLMTAFNCGSGMPMSPQVADVDCGGIDRGGGEQIAGDASYRGGAGDRGMRLDCRNSTCGCRARNPGGGEVGIGVDFASGGIEEREHAALQVGKRVAFDAVVCEFEFLGVGDGDPAARAVGFVGDAGVEELPEVGCLVALGPVTDSQDTEADA